MLLLGRGLAVKDQRGTCNPPVGLSGFGEVRCADAAARAALRPEVRRRAGVQCALGLGRVCNSAEEHAQDMCKHVQRSCEAVRGCRAFATAELRQGSPASGAQAIRVHPGNN